MNLRKLVIINLCLFSVCIVLASYFLVTSPIAFQKCVVITVSDDFFFQKSKEPIDIGSIISEIPYVDEDEIETVYAIEPEQLYMETIEKGEGNCSNLSSGLSYKLLQLDHKHHIVHILPVDGFLDGHGHTVVSACFELDENLHHGIVDVLEGGVVADNSEPIDLEDLIDSRIDNPSIISLSEYKDEESRFFGDYLDNCVISIQKYNDIKTYNDFIETVYFSLGSAVAEKYLFDALAIVLGYYPPQYVTAESSYKLFKNNQAQRFIALSLLFSSRLFLISFISLCFDGFGKALYKIFIG